MLQSIKKTANGLVALFKDGTSFKFNQTVPVNNLGATPGSLSAWRVAATQFIDLPQGSWIFNGCGNVAGTTTTYAAVGLSTNSSDDSTGLIMSGSISKGNTGDSWIAISLISPYPYTVSTTTRLYLKTYNVGAASNTSLLGFFQRVG